MDSSRRMFLRGAAGFTLGLPFLPSLLSPNSARAAEPPVPKNFVAFATHHGGIWTDNMFPALAAATAEKKSYAGREIRRGPLTARTEGTDTVLSPVLRARAADLTPALIAKMNVLTGVDIPFYIGHHTGGHLGNYARNDGNGNDGKVVQATPSPTIDQVMAWSKSFYPDLSNVRERSLVIGRRISYGWSNPETRSGTVQEMASEESSLELFNRIFVAAADPATARTPVVDKVLADYKRLRDGSRRLSPADRTRLDDHMQRLSELQRKLNARATCGAVAKPGSSNAVRAMAGYDFNPDLQAKAFDLLNDVIVAAFVCGTSRVAVVNAGSTFSDFTGDWHQDVAHKAHLPDGAKQKIIAAAHQRFFANVYVDLMKKLDVDDGTGKTLLDRSLIAWTQESCTYTHENQSVPIVLAGGAGGAIKTGGFCDYRDLTKMVNDGGYEGATEKTYAGLCWNQYLGTVLQAVGVSKSEYERDGLGGYGIKFIGEGRAKHYPDAIFSVMGESLPFLA